MELTPPAAVSSLLSHYQLQQIHASRNNEKDGSIPQTLTNHYQHHHFSVKDKDKHLVSGNSSREGDSTNRFPVVHRNYGSSNLQSENNHGNQQSLHQIDQQPIQGQHTNTDSSSVVSLQAQETSKFFMSSLLNLSSGPGNSSSESTLPYQGPGNN